MSSEKERKIGRRITPANRPSEDLQDVVRIRDQIRVSLQDAVKKYVGAGFEEDSRGDMGTVEFLERLKASNGRYLGNIVHQGVRDHFGMGEHSGNIGMYDDELEKILSSGRLLSSMRIKLEDENFFEKAKKEIQELMEKEDPWWPPPDLEEATNLWLRQNFSQGMGHQGLTDNLALHFSSNHILDEFYGGETNNEVFFVVPEKWLLKDHLFWSRGARSEKDTQYNDVYTWPNEDVPSAVEIEKALIFVPRDINVDPKTGSQYKIVEGKAALDIDEIEKAIKPEFIEDRSEILAACAESERDEVERFLQLIAMHKHLSEMSQSIEYFLNPEGIKPDRVSRLFNRLEEKGFNLDILRKAFEKTGEKVFNFFKNYTGIFQYKANNANGKFYAKPETTIRSKEYFDQLFRRKISDAKVTEISEGRQDMVEYRGKDKDGKERIFRVVFYSDSDPNRAVETMYMDFGISFDKTVLSNEGKTNATDYDEVPYRYDYEELKGKLLKMMKQ